MRRYVIIMKKNLQDKFKLRKIKHPNKLLAGVLFAVLGRIAKKRGATYTYDFDVKEVKKKPFILLSTHGSRDDYMYNLYGMRVNNIHIVCGYRNVFQKYVYGIFKSLGVIAKYLYQPDTTAVKQMLQSVKMGDSLFLAPEGIQSTSGSTHPVNPATMNFIKKCKLPVILCKTNGSYLTRTRYSTDVKKGKMNFHYTYLFSPEELENSTNDQLYAKLMEHFKYNEYDYNRERKIAFKGEKPNAYGLEKIIYKCPHCNSEFRISVTGEQVECLDCGYKVKMDEFYLLNPVSKDMIFDDTDKWYKWQRKIVHNEIKSDDFVLTQKVKLSDINPYKLGKNFSSREIGEGVLTLTNKGLHYEGSQLGESVDLFFEAEAVYSLIFDLNGGLALYYKNKFYNFTLLDKPLEAVKWMIASEEIHNLYDDAWKTASEQVYDY